MSITELLSSDHGARKARDEGGIDGFTAYVHDHADAIIPNLDDDALDFIEQANELILLSRLPGIHDRLTLPAAA
jgi:hypothetical protein